MARVRGYLVSSASCCTSEFDKQRLQDAFQDRQCKSHSCASFTVSQVETQNLNTEDHSDAHACLLSASATWLERFSLT